MDIIKNHRAQILRISKQGQKLVIVIPQSSSFQHNEQVLVSPISFEDIKVEVSQ